MFRSVRVRLTLWYVLLVAVILLAFSSGIYAVLRKNLYDNLGDSIRSRASTYLEVIEYRQGRPVPAAALSENDPSAGEHFVRFFDSAGAVTFDNSAAAGGAPIDSRAVDDALRGEVSTRAVVVGGETMRVRTAPIEREGVISGVVEVGQSQGDVTDTLNALLLILAVAVPLTLVVASFGGVFLAGRALSPIDRLTRMARRISAEDLDLRLDLDLPDDEVGRLAGTLDDMIARLDAAFRRQRQFTADASHELRTPLTAIKGQAEVALSKPRKAADYRAVLLSVNEEADRLIRMVGSLLTLARADAGQIPLAEERVELGDLVAAAVEQVRPLAKQRGLELTAEATAALAVEGDEDLILQLVLNLLDNAIKYTSRGGSVMTGWRSQDERAELWVRDTGTGIGVEHQQRIFDRFYRVDGARRRAEGGAGLGLSICRWIAEAHGGGIRVRSEPGDGTEFTVELPLNHRRR